jgi:poly(A) polymerase
MKEMPSGQTSHEAGPHAKLAELSRLIEHGPEFAFTKGLVERFPQAGLYVVGGAVRDTILGRTPKDYDFIVTKVAPSSLEEFLASQGRVDLTGRNFGVFKFRPRGIELAEDFDLALPRRDFAAGTGGYRDVETQSDPNLPVEADLARRDFTVNAMAWDVRQNILLDPYGGQADLESRIIRAVGEPKERFNEDYSRMLRGLRQATQFGFDFDPDTWTAIQSEIAHLNDATPKGEYMVPREVIAKELLKSLDQNPVRTMDLWDESGAFTTLMPDLLKLKGCEQSPDYHSEGDAWQHTRLLLEKLGSEEFRRVFGVEKVPVEVVLAGMFHDIGKPKTRKVSTDGAGHISFNGHDEVGSHLAGRLSRRLKIHAVPGLGVPTENIAWLVGNHMFTHTSEAQNVRPSTIAKRFLDPNRPGRELLMLSWADSAASLRPDGQSDTTHEDEYLRVVEKLRQTFTQGEIRPKALIDGAQVMQILQIKSGTQVGEMLDRLLDAQAQGLIHDAAEAEEYVRHSLR